MIKGIALSPGIARGTAHWVGSSRELAAPGQARDSRGSQVEALRLAAACRQAGEELAALETVVGLKGGAAVAEIFASQALLLADPAFLDRVVESIESAGSSAEAAVAAVASDLAGALGRVADPYFRERAADLRDVARRLLAALGGTGSAGEIPPGSILVTAEIEPSWVARLDPTKVRGVVTEHGALSSHASILLRSFGLPAVGGVALGDESIPAGAPLLIDGLAGLVFVDPGKKMLAEYEQLSQDLEAHDELLAAEVGMPAVTLDGSRVRLLANLGKLADTEAALHWNADGVGLYRTEFAFDIRDRFPTEDEQHGILAGAAERMAPRPVVVRMLDLGADKTLRYFPLPPTPNPALNLRGTRLLLAYPEILRTQLRAILRTSAAYPVSILLPMIGGLDEVLRFRQALAEAKVGLAAERVDFNPAIPVGGMIEVPGAALMAPELARELDFLSLGTNDLIQFVLAADREDPAMASYHQALHPAVLRLLGSVARAARKAGKDLTLCGEMAGDPFYTELLIGLGLRSFSVAPRQLAAIRHEIRRTDCRAAGNLARRLLRLVTATEVEGALERRHSRRRIALS